MLLPRLIAAAGADRRYSVEIAATVADRYGATALVHIRINVIDDDALAQHDEEQQDHRRNVDRAEIGHGAADRPQNGLGQIVEQRPNRADEVVADVDDVE